MSHALNIGFARVPVERNRLPSHLFNRAAVLDMPLDLGLSLRNSITPGLSFWSPVQAGETYQGYVNLRSPGRHRASSGCLQPDLPKLPSPGGCRDSPLCQPFNRKDRLGSQDYRLDGQTRHLAASGRPTQNSRSSCLLFCWLLGLKERQADRTGEGGVV